MTRIFILPAVLTLLIISIIGYFRNSTSAPIPDGLRYFNIAGFKSALSGSLLLYANNFQS